MAQILALAGVNGAGKSSLLGMMLAEDGATWFNPDSFTHELVQAGWPQLDANAAAWQEGRRRLERAIVEGTDYALETTLGGNTIPALLRQACDRHEVSIWFCGLTDVALHLRRVAERVAAGGHDIPEAKIRQRFDSARLNLIKLMPHLASLHVYDNSTPVDADGQASPMLVLEMNQRQILYPTTNDELAAVPTWAKPIVMAALELPTARAK